MQIVIDIPNSLYANLQKIQRGSIASKRILDCVKNGIPLPKGHGRLIDADKYLKSVCTYKETGCGSCKLQTTCPVDAPTIIEADKEIQNGFSSICKY